VDEIAAAVFQTNVETDSTGRDIAAVTVAEDGKTDLLVFHARPYRDVKPRPACATSEPANTRRVEADPSWGGRA
jgi:GH43 family beta-xylosidase